MSDSLLGKQLPAANLATIRELFAGVLACVVVGAFLALIILAVWHASGPDFGPIKELIALVNASFGFVLGYYLSRTTSESRAERAESSASVAERVAGEAAARADAARAESKRLSAQLSNAHAALEIVLRAADDIGSRGFDPGDPLTDTEEMAAVHGRLALALEIGRPALERRG
jgi:hypothetical protein